MKADRSEDEPIDQLKQETIERVNKEMESEDMDEESGAAENLSSSG